MLRKIRSGLSRRGRFPSPAIAGHSLRRGGSIAGRIDEVADGRLRGWICDAADPARPLSLRLLVDGAEVRTFVADLHRADIDALIRNGGLNGFEIDLNPYLRSGSVTIAIEVAGNRAYRLGPLVVIANTVSGRAGGALSSSMSIDQKLQHIFDHVSATFEQTAQKLEALRSETEALRLSGGGGDLDGAPRAAVLGRSAISGVGAFHGDAIDEAREVGIMAARIEARLSALALSS